MFKEMFKEKKKTPKTKEKDLSNSQAQSGTSDYKTPRDETYRKSREGKFLKM